MTEIKIEKRRAIWPLLLVLAIVAVVLYFLFGNKKEAADEEQPVAALTGTEEANRTVAALVSFVNADTITMGLDHAYAHEALIRLTDATSAVAAHAGFSIQADLDQVKSYAAAITQDPYVATHADTIRKAADILSGVIQNIQQAKFPALGNEATELKTAAAAIDPAVLTLDQKDAVKSFFRKAADLLQKMN